MMKINLNSPAKINLYLRVLNQNADGYHDIETSFQYIDLYDYMSFEKTDDDICIESNKSFLEKENNTIYQSAKLLFNKSDQKSGVNIKIEKNIPIGAGLGGGSSNAASTIIALNKLWDIDMNKSELFEIGKTIGADVPFFLYGNNAKAKGIGDQLELSDSIKENVLLIDPGINNSSGEMFHLLDLWRKTNKGVSSHAQNSFWDIFLNQNKNIEEFYLTISHNYDLKLSGSGSCMFITYDKEKELEEILKKIPTNWRFFYCKPLQYSPICYIK